jgi:hypothetical protein
MTDVAKIMLSGSLKANWWLNRDLGKAGKRNLDTDISSNDRDRTGYI